MSFKKLGQKSRHGGENKICGSKIPLDFFAVLMYNIKRNIFGILPI